MALQHFPSSPSQVSFIKTLPAKAAAAALAGGNPRMSALVKALERGEQVSTTVTVETMFEALWHITDIEVLTKLSRKETADHRETVYNSARDRLREIQRVSAPSEVPLTNEEWTANLLAEPFDNIMSRFRFLPGRCLDKALVLNWVDNLSGDDQRRAAVALITGDSRSGFVSALVERLAAGQIVLHPDDWSYSVTRSILRETTGQIGAVVAENAVVNSDSLEIAETVKSRGATPEALEVFAKHGRYDLVLSCNQDTIDTVLDAMIAECNPIWWVFALAHIVSGEAADAAVLKVLPKFFNLASLVEVESSYVPARRLFLRTDISENAQLLLSRLVKATELADFFNKNESFVFANAEEIGAAFNEPLRVCDASAFMSYMMVAPVTPVVHAICVQILSQCPQALSKGKPSGSITGIASSMAAERFGDNVHAWTLYWALYASHTGTYKDLLEAVCSLSEE